jgi:hypothetical protein
MDLDSLNPDPDTDPDPAFQVNLDPYPAFQVNPDQDPIWIQGFDDQKLKKKKYTRIFFFFQKLQFNVQARRSLQLSKENIQHVKK